MKGSGRDRSGVHISAVRQKNLDTISGSCYVPFGCTPQHQTWAEHDFTGSAAIVPVQYLAKSKTEGSIPHVNGWKAHTDSEKELLLKCNPSGQARFPGLHSLHEADHFRYESRSHKASARSTCPGLPDRNAETVT